MNSFGWLADRVEQLLVVDLIAEGLTDNLTCEYAALAALTGDTQRLRISLSELAPS